MKIPRPALRRTRIDIVPLIDVMFLLLVFFIYAMLSMAVHRALPIRLPTSSTAAVDMASQAAITITSDGGLFLDKAPVTEDTLPLVLQQRRQEKPDVGVQLFADQTVPTQRLIAVLDMVRKAGVTQVSIQARTEASP